MVGLQQPVTHNSTRAAAGTAAPCRPPLPLADTRPCLSLLATAARVAPKSCEGGDKPRGPVCAIMPARYPFFGDTHVLPCKYHTPPQLLVGDRMLSDAAQASPQESPWVWPQNLRKPHIPIISPSCRQQERLHCSCLLLHAAPPTPQMSCCVVSGWTSCRRVQEPQWRRVEFELKIKGQQQHPSALFVVPTCWGTHQASAAGGAPAAMQGNSTQKDGGSGWAVSNLSASGTVAPQQEDRLTHVLGKYTFAQPLHKHTPKEPGKVAPQTAAHMYRPPLHLPALSGRTAASADAASGPLAAGAAAAAARCWIQLCCSSCAAVGRASGFSCSSCLTTSRPDWLT